MNKGMGGAMDRRPEYNKELIGDNLRRCRQERNLSVEQVREYLGLGSIQSIYKWEEGRSFPQADNLFALMELYGMELKDLLYGHRQFGGAALGEAVCSGAADAGFCEAALEEAPYSGAEAHGQTCELTLEQQLYGEQENMQGVKRWVLYIGKISRLVA